MTEAEWLASEEPTQMIELLWNGVSDLKLRMFAVAWARCHLTMSETNEPSAWRAIEASEQFADGTISEEELITARGPVFDDSKRLHRNVALGTACVASGLTAQKIVRQIATLLRLQVGRVLKEDQVSILRDILGNPFRPVAFSPSWRTDTAVALAQQMYASRDFSPMPILADALQDAGCDNEHILSHCRDEKQGHVRGCWVVDLVLGKE